jgi:predicted  nucleic acid-binding Zn-ribbon protein
VSTESHTWGRVADDGTVYVRTSEGERVVGIWQAGSPDEALAFFTRRYDSLATEVSLLERRINATDLATGQAKATISRLHAAIDEAKAVGDLEGLKRRLDALSGQADVRQQEHKAARDRARVEAIATKERIVVEAEKLAAEATHWKSSGERLKELLEEWKAAPHGDRQAEASLWKRMSAARSAFAKRRKTYFAALEEEREGIRERKQEIVTRAEELSASTDWAATAAAYRELMASWKDAGRADRAAEDELWKRFRAAQSTFFEARSTALSAKDNQLRERAVAKEELLAEAEKLLPITDPKAAKGALRSIHQRWDKIGSVAREAQDRLEGGLKKVDDAVRKAEDVQWRRTNPEAMSRARDTVEQIRKTIQNLEGQLEQANKNGDEAARDRASAALQTRRGWLTEAEKTLADLTG